MKKALIVVIALALAVWVISWFRADDAVATSAAQAWPGTLGTLDSAFDRYPAVQANDASRKLASLADALPKSDAVDEFVRREIARAEPAIGQPPALPDVTAIRELLLRETVVWDRDPSTDLGESDSMTKRALLMTMARALVASGLSKARSGDASSWEDMHAVWKLARSLDGHPQVMAQTAALSMARMVNAVAWKLPLPAPSWLAELQARDVMKPMLEAFQCQSASYWKDGAQMFPTKWLANSVEHDRRIAETLYGATACSVTVPMNELGTDMRSVWQRTLRFRAEREASANAMRIREGKPIETKSMCSDGTWSFDGTTLRFSRDLPSGTTERPMPLVLRVKP